MSLPMAVLSAPARATTPHSGSASADRGAGFGAALAAAGTTEEATASTSSASTSSASPNTASKNTDTAAGTDPAELGIPASGAGSDDCGADAQTDGNAPATALPIDAQRPTSVTPGWGAFAGFALNATVAGRPEAPAAGSAGAPIAAVGASAARLGAASDAVIPTGTPTAATAPGTTEATTPATVAAAIVAPSNRGRGDAGAVPAAPATSASVADHAQSAAAPLGAAQQGVAQPGVAQLGAAQAVPASQASIIPAAAAATATRPAPTPAPAPVAAATATDEPVPADAARPHALAPASAAPVAQSTAPLAAAAAAVAPARPAAAAQHPPLASQLSRPLLTLAHAGDGSHSITITVAPDRLGPVTVQAVVMGDQLRVELFAPTDLARDAVRGVLAELRRDLAATGIHATLGLSADDAPARQGQQGQQSSQNQGGALGQPGGQAGREARPGEHPSDARSVTQPDTDPAPAAEGAAPTQLHAASAHPHIDLIA